MAMYIADFQIIFSHGVQSYVKIFEHRYVNVQCQKL